MQWKLIELRNKYNFSREDIATALEMSERAYAMRERGEIQFKMNEMFAISEIFSVPLDHIFLNRNSTDTEIEEEAK